MIFDNGRGGGSGLNLDGVQDSLLANNLLHGNHASGISLFRIDGAEGSRDNVVVNNTVLQAADGRWALNIQDGSTGNIARNNILLSAHPFRGSLDISADSLEGLFSDYNVLMHRFTTDGGNTRLDLDEWQTATGQDAHSLVATLDELFADPETENYRLRFGSPAVDAGTEFLAPLLDLDRLPRPAGEGFDIGAYEWLARLPNPLVGDANLDGRVDLADFAILKGNFGQAANGPAQGDFDVNGLVDLQDFTLLKQNFGAVADVPEPTSWVPALLAVASLRITRRRKLPAPD